MDADTLSDAPIAVGGVGGSGTRLVAQLLKDAGVWMGNQSNSADDCLLYSFLFSQPEALAISAEEFAERFEVFECAMLGRTLSDRARALVVRLVDRPDSGEPGMRSRAWRRAQGTALLNSGGSLPNPLEPCRWGWKVPNTHVVLDRLSTLRPRLRYIHVVRNGLDMAFSKNTRQLRVWGRRLFGMDDADLSPQNILRYWSLANRRAMQIGQTMGERFFVLDYDSLVSDPRPELARLLTFAGLELDEAERGELARSIRRPASIGRAKTRDLSPLAHEDVEFVRSLGFETYGA